MHFKPTLIMLTLFNLNLICSVFCFNLFQLDYSLLLSLHELYDTCAPSLIEARVQ